MKMCAENHTVNQARFAKETSIPTIRPAAIAFLCGLGVLALFTGLAQAQTDASQIALQHPGWIRVPGSLVRPDCVHQIPKGAGPRIENGRDTGDVSLNGMIIAHYDPCPEDATIRFAQETSESSVITNATGSGLVEASYWDDTSLGSSDNMDFVGNDLTVPSKPTKNGGTLDLFTEIYAQSGGTYDWLVEAEDLTTGAFSYQDDVSTGLHFNFAISGALTVGNLTSCSEFPASKAVFSGTVVDHGFPSYNKLSPKWVGSTYSYGGPSCSFSVTPGNKTTLKY